MKIRAQDKIKNSSGLRRTLAPLPDENFCSDKDTDPHPPLLRKILVEYAATGLPPAYIPKDNKQPSIKEVKREQ